MNEYLCGMDSKNVFTSLESFEEAFLEVEDLKDLVGCKLIAALEMYGASLDIFCPAFAPVEEQVACNDFLERLERYQEALRAQATVSWLVLDSLLWQAKYDARFAFDIDEVSTTLEDPSALLYNGYEIASISVLVDTPTVSGYVTCSSYDYYKVEFEYFLKQGLRPLKLA